MQRVLVCVVVCVLLVLPFGAATVTAQSDRAHEVIELVNAFRATYGLSAFQVDPMLTAAAQKHVDWMVANHTFGHTGEGGSTPTDRARAAGYIGIIYENYVGGTDLDPAGAVEWWKNSPIHRATLLSQNVHVGVGTAAAGGQITYVLMAGTPGQRPEAPKDTAPDDGGDPTADPILVVPVIVATPREDGSVVHVVEYGQTAWDISARYGVPLDDILTLNHLSRDSVLHPGEEVFVRLGPGQSPPPAPTLPAVHVLQEGETVWTVAAIYGTTVDELLALNGLERGVILYPGDQIKLRAPDPTATMTPLPTVTLLPPTITPTLASPTPAATGIMVLPTATLTATPTITVTPVPARAQQQSADTDSTSVEDYAAVGVIVIAVGLGAAIIAAYVLMGREEE